MFRLKNTFDEVAEKIEEENKLEKLLEIKSEKELYDFFKDNGYSKSEGEFKADIEKLIAESSIDLKNSDLNKVAGGAMKKNLTKLTSAGMASMLVLGGSSMSPKAHASDMYHFTDYPATSIQKSSKKGGSEAKKIILTMLGLSGATAITGITGLGVLGIDQLYKEREIAGRIEKAKELKEELNEMKKIAKSYSLDFCSRIEECSDKLESLEKKPSSLSESEFETVQKMVEGVKKDFQDAKDKRAQEEKQAKAKAEAEAEAEQKAKEEKLKAQKQAEKEETERQKALEREEKQKRKQIDELNKSIQELKDSLGKCLKQMSWYNKVFYDEEFASCVEKEIQVLEGLENIPNFDEKSERFESVKDDTEKLIRSFSGAMVADANDLLSGGREIVSRLEEMSCSCENIEELSGIKYQLEDCLESLERWLSVHNNANSLSEEVHSFCNVHMWTVNVKLALNGIVTILKAQG